MEAIYTVDRKLRTPEEMAARFRNVVESVTASDIRCSAEDWRGCCESNLRQINHDDLYVEDNEYCEGGDQVRVVSTSQLEGFHAGLKTLVGRAVSAQLGLRILDIFIVQHNLKIGAKFGRNPAFGDLDFLSLAQAAIVCNGVLPETPQLAFALHVLSEPLVAPQYRSASAIDFDFSKWHRMFATARVAPDNLEAALTSPHHHYQSVKELLLKSSMSVVANRVDKHTFLASLKLDENDYEPATGFSAQEYELLRQLQKEQEQMDRTWSKSPLVTTVMFNIIVANNPNAALPLHRRSYSTIVARIATLSKHHIKSESKSHGPIALVCLQFTSAVRQRRQTLHMNNPFRSSFLSHFEAPICSEAKKKLFRQMYDFASHVCDGIFPKEELFLDRKWDALKRAYNRGSSLKIKLKLQRVGLNEAVTTSKAADLNRSTTEPIDKAPNTSGQSQALRPNTAIEAAQSSFDSMGEQTAPNCPSLDTSCASRDSPTSVGTPIMAASTHEPEQVVASSRDNILPPQLRYEFDFGQAPAVMTDEDIKYFGAFADSIPKNTAQMGIYSKQIP